MKKILFLIFISFSFLYSMQTIKPELSFKASGGVQDIYYENSILYIATDNGTVEIFDIKANKKIKTVEIPQIKDFMGDLIPAKIYSIDKIDRKFLIVSQGMKGYRNLWIYQNDKLEKVIDIDMKYFIQKASFIDSDKILFALLSNQIGVYNLETKKLDYLVQVSHSSFSHFKLSEDKKSFATTDESGIVRVIDTNSAKVQAQPKALNLDKVFQVDYKKGVILTAGQDRKAAVYESFSSYALDFEFLLYACALSPDAKFGAVAYNEKNEVLVFDVKSKDYLYNLSGQDATLTQIIFINDKELITSSDSETINYWRLK